VRGTARKKLKSALAFLDLGQSFSGANRDGWRLSNRQNTSGGGFFRTIFFLSTEKIQLKKKKKIVLKKTQ
jgi:hypothetical protein